MSVKLKVVDGVIVVAEDGYFVVPETVPSDPLRIDRFIVGSDGHTISLDPYLEGVANDELDNLVFQREQGKGFHLVKQNITNSIWKLISAKTIHAKKVIRGKPNISDADFEILMATDMSRRRAAEDGKDVFELQSMLESKTQAVIRTEILAAAALWDEQMLILEDKIESVRRILENKVDSAVSEEDILAIKSIVHQLSALDVNATSADIAQILTA